MSTILEQVIEQHTNLAQHRHTPTKGMQTFAKKGLRLAKQHGDMDPAALSVGRKIASGSHLTDSHVEQMASFHAAHNGPCSSGDDQDSCEDMLWGGSAGAQWSGARVAALDVTSLSETPGPTVLQLDQDGKGVSLEVFVRDHLGEEPTTESDGLLWAPVLRSGMLATRPGPNGTKVHEPLVFVPGYATDPHKEIGLQNLVDSFEAGAVQHVTIPTTHENNVLDNTGFIKGLKIVDSRRRPGEKVLVAGHDFRDPDVKKKIGLGTIANRSCGIVYDYTNTESGKTYDQVIDHVALTNKPWVTGMTPYGEIESEEDFADREVVPMLLSEAPRESTIELDLSWDGSESRFDDQQWAKSCVLDRGAEFKTAKQRYSLPIREPGGSINPDGVSAAAGRIKSVKGASLSQKKAAARKLIAAYSKTGDEPPEDLRELVSAKTNMSADERAALNLADVQWGNGELSMNHMLDQVTACLSEMTDPEEMYPYFSVFDVVGNPDPKALVRVSYGDPAGVDDKWVIPLEVDGDQVSLSDYAKWVPVEQQWVTDDDAAQDKTEVSDLLKSSPNNLSGIGLSTESSPRPNRAIPVNPLEGGAVKPTMTEAVDRLQLSDEQKAVFDTLLSQSQRLESQLKEVTKKSREDAIKSRVKALQEAGHTPGFCRTYEEIALGDEGGTAALNLSDSDGNSTGSREYTVTEIADRLIAALPVDKSGKLAFAEKADLLTSPISGRPPLDPKDQADSEDHGSQPLSGEEWLKQASKFNPGFADEAQRTFNFSAQKGA